MTSDFSRRRFVEFLTALSAGAALGVKAQTRQARRQPVPASQRSATRNRKNLVATQVKAYAWQDEGIDKLLDNLQEKGNVNTVFAFTFLSEPTDVSGRIPLPDHGTYSKADPEIGGAFYDYDLKYFAGTTLKEFHAKNKFNVISEVGPKMKARGMDFFAWDYNNTNANMMRLIPGFTEVAEIDVYGKRTDSACWNHPNYRAQLTGRIESYLLQYPDQVAGIIWGCERMGPLDNMIGGGWATTGISCFCPYCCAKGRERGISVDRAKSGFIELDQLFQAARNEQRPPDGYFVTFWRILLEYPEVLAWHTLWNDSYHEIRAELYGTAKAIAPEKPFGFHIVQNITFSPFYSAADNYAKIQHYTDFVKIATYNNAGGGRMASFINRLCSTIFADAKPQDLTPFYYKIMNFDEKPYDELSAAGLSVDYIARETKRAIADTGHSVQIYPSVDINVPIQSGWKQTTPEGVKAEVEASFDAGADGIVLSREYTEMWLANLAAAGDATRAIFAKS
ncbi:MAG TPA: hypothetical protein VFB43_14925 [Terracidiphilus sp.]|nr:hypothetical protein [Terracidiphilus sp.]